MINNMVFDGTKVMSIDIKNTESEPNIVPTPDFPSYRKDPSTAPGVDLLKDPRYADKAVPTINMNGKDAKVPVVYKANLSYAHFFSDRLKMNVSGYMTLGRNNYMYIDRNMVDEPLFRLTAEANRGVYVPVSAIDITNGTLDWMAGRKSEKVGQFRHKLVVYGSAPTFWGITVGARFSGIGGIRYSLIVNGNVNGDFVPSNDLAYIYDPNDSATPEYIREGINSILNNPNAEQGLKDYIRISFGKVAERNGGVNGFYGTLGLRLAKKFKVYKKQNIEVSVDMFNVTNDRALLLWQLN